MDDVTNIYLGLRTAVPVYGPRKDLIRSMLGWVRTLLMLAHLVQQGHGIKAFVKEVIRRTSIFLFCKKIYLVKSSQQLSDEDEHHHLPDEPSMQVSPCSSWRDGRSRETGSGSSSEVLRNTSPSSFAKGLPVKATTAVSGGIQHCCLRDELRATARIHAKNSVKLTLVCTLSLCSASR